VCAKFRCAPLRIKKALEIFRELITKTARTTRVVFWDPLSGSKKTAWVFYFDSQCTDEFAQRVTRTVCAKKVTPFWYPSFLPLLDALYLQFLFTYISFSLNA